MKKKKNYTYAWIIHIFFMSSCRMSSPRGSRRTHEYLIKNIVIVFRREARFVLFYYYYYFFFILFFFSLTIKINHGHN